jgi:mono/diheme cytochrome c family protein
MHLRAPAAAIAAAIVASGCGGGGTEQPPPADGRAVFARSCGGCHTLTAAGTRGAVGPNFDDSERLSEAQIRRQLNLGVGGMPSFRRSLTPPQQAAVSAFLARAMRERPSRVKRQQ